MPTYAILNRGPTQDVGAIVREKYPDAFVWSPQVAFVRDTASPLEVSKKIDMILRQEGEQFKGTYDQLVVIQIAPSYWGYTDMNLWAWLKSAFEATA